MNHLHSAVWWNDLLFITGALPLVLHDNAHSHVSRPVTNLLANDNGKLWSILSLLSEHRSLWYWSAPKDELLLTGKQFCSMEGVMETTQLSVAETNKNQPTDGICQHQWCGTSFTVWQEITLMAGNGSFQVNKAVMYVQHSANIFHSAAYHGNGEDYMISFFVSIPTQRNMCSTVLISPVSYNWVLGYPRQGNNLLYRFNPTSQQWHF